jgi:lysozyme
LSRDEKLLALLALLTGVGAWLWLTQSGQQTALQIESGVKRVIDLTDSTLQTIIGFESFSALPYPDAGGYSIGYGHFMGASPTMSSINMADAYDLLRADVSGFSDAVKRAIVQPMTQNQYDAMVSLAYNIGAAGFTSSTVARLFNAGDIQGAADAFRMWNKSQGSVSPALVARREQERALFLS